MIQAASGVSVSFVRTPPGSANSRPYLNSQANAQGQMNAEAVNNRGNKIMHEQKRSIKLSFESGSTYTF
jgi:hypothetical protein